MQRLKILSLVLMAVFASSMIVSATVSAEAVRVLNSKGEQGEILIKALFKSNLVFISLVGFEVKCEEIHYEFHFEPNSALGLFHSHFLKCTAQGGQAICQGLGDERGQILLLGTFHMVYDSLTTLGSGILLLTEHAHFTCGGLVLVLTLGELLCLLTPTNSLTNIHTIKCEQSGTGDPSEVVYWKDDGSGTEVKLKESFLVTQNDERYEGAAPVGSFNIEGKEAKEEFSVMV
jgi:hypothetical protein